MKEEQRMLDNGETPGLCVCVCVCVQVSVCYSKSFFSAVFDREKLASGTITHVNPCIIHCTRYTHVR